MHQTAENNNQRVDELKFLLNNISHAILFESQANEILFINQNFCDLFSIPVAPDLLTGADCSKAAEQSAGLFKYPEKFVSGILDIYRAGEPVLNEELIMSDGRSIYRDYKPIPATTGYSGHLWIYKHSLELRSILKEVEEQKNFYERLLHNIPADIAIFDREHKYIFLNQVAISKEGMRHWMIGKDDFDYCRQYNKPPYLALSRRALFLEAIQTGSVVEFEEENLTPAGHKVYNLRRFYPLMNEDGSVQNVIGYGMNITRIREREEMIRQQEESFRNLVDSMDQMVVTLDVNGTIVYSNQQWSQVMEPVKGDSIGKKLDTYIKKGKEAFFGQIKQVFNDEKENISKSNITIACSSGNKRVFSFHLSGIKNPVTGEVRVAIYFNDITEQLAAAKKLKKIANAEKKLNSLKSSFMSLVSHELRTPLSVILSSAELIEFMVSQSAADNPPDMNRYTDRIIRQVDKMTHLMSEFLFLSKVEAGRVPFSPKKMNISEFLQKLKLELFNPWKDGRELQFSEKGVRSEVVADELMISYLVSNLLTNAFKYSPEASAPHLRLYYFKRSWKLLIVDSGIGIPAEQIKKIFQPFSRGRNVGDIEGSGFGLNIVKIFIKTHKGNIRIKSTEGKGTAVLLQFPYM